MALPPLVLTIARFATPSTLGNFLNEGLQYTYEYMHLYSLKVIHLFQNPDMPVWQRQIQVLIFALDFILLQ